MYLDNYIVIIVGNEFHLCKYKYQILEICVILKQTIVCLLGYSLSRLIVERHL